MKILFTFYNPSGGMETLNRVRSRALMRAGHECHLLYTHDGQGRKNISGIKTFITGNDYLIERLIERENYDVIVVCTDIFLLEKIRNWDYEGKVIFEIQGLGTYETARAILQDFAARVQVYADALLYPKTDHLIELMRELFPRLPQFCFDDPLDAEQFGYESYPKKPFPIVGWVGRLEKNKNWQEYLLIGNNLRGYYPDLQLWMFDDDTLSEPPEKALFEQTLRYLGLKDRLVRHSNIPHEQMSDYMSIIGDSGGFLCSTSIMEGFGYAVAEAMLCRCPVLSTDSDGVRRFIRHDKTGKFYRRGDIAHATAEALSLMRDHSRRAAIVEAADQHIRTQFSPQLYTKQFTKMMRQLGCND
ncbi:glycosyltransferase family 4 protein [Cohnella hashimotonis]|uniref:Glycosyltransferase family 4 protein n=1 Tax=Cohnella hashimotonis TaxID=2826895 RepID=A0ABT6TP94_9BACL|nr:glycosyltransferase family 4 protein [Cohnella hashimotonis]MDI4648115.1 glycosyltransferase family 4 protein [Cohnella hashimotonis]